MNRVDTLRISVTDRCNLRCTYCMPEQGIKLIPHEEILRFEEILRIVRAGVSLGISKIRLTGGEPLTRKSVTELVRMIAGVKEIKDLCMTTNGTLLKKHAQELKKAGLGRITVSLDTLKKEKYKTITRSDMLDLVMAGIEAAREQQLEPVKINVVVVKGVNDDEIQEFVELAIKQRIEVRFIERMPFLEKGDVTQCGWPGKEMVPSSVVREIIEKKYGSLMPVKSELPIPGPARLFKITGHEGRIGFISPMTEAFCSSCTRMRLTADGKLRPCLVEEMEFDIKTPMRSGADDEELRNLFLEAVKAKPHQEVACYSMIKKRMAQIGG